MELSELRMGWLSPAELFLTLVDGCNLGKLSRRPASMSANE